MEYYPVKGYETALESKESAIRREQLFIGSDNAFFQIKSQLHSVW